MQRKNKQRYPLFVFALHNYRYKYVDSSSIEHIEYFEFILRLIPVDSKAQSSLARLVIIQIPTHGRYTAELPLRRIKLFSFQANWPLCAKYSHIVDFLGFRRMDIAPTSIEVLLRPTPGQSDEFKYGLKVKMYELFIFK